jgi:hypothetical protein
MYWYQSVRITLCELAKKIILRKWKKNVRVRNENYGRRHYLRCGLDPGLAFGTLRIGTVKNPECTLRSGSTNWIRKNTYFCTKHTELRFSTLLQVQDWLFKNFILFWKTGNSGDKTKFRKNPVPKFYTYGSQRGFWFTCGPDPGRLGGEIRIRPRSEKVATDVNTEENRIKLVTWLLENIKTMFHFCRRKLCWPKLNLGK